MSELLTTLSSKKYLLDRVRDAEAAYALHRLKRGYSGAAVRVRRSSDNEETDVRFIGNRVTLDSPVSAGGSFGDWVGSNSAFVTTWYDQSGNGNDATQSTAADQPRIVNAGTLDADDNGRAAINFDGSSDRLAGTAAALVAVPDSDHTVLLVCTPAAATSTDAAYSWSGTDDEVMYPNDTAAGSGGARVFRRNFGDTIINEDRASLVNTHLLYSVRTVSTTYTVRRNGAEVAEDSGSGTSSSGWTEFAIGDFESVRFFTGDMQAVVVYARDLGSQLSTSERELNKMLEVHSEPPHVDIMLVAGQSNAEGRGDSAESPSVESGTAHHWNGSALADLEDPVGGANTGSAWPAFANAYYAVTGRVLVVLEQATGATAQIEEADSGAGWWTPDGTLYPAAKTALDDAISSVKSLHHIVDRVMIAWSQGEREAVEIDASTAGVTKAAYKAGLEEMIAEFRSDYGSDTPFLIFRTGAPNTGDTTGFQQIRAAQDEVAAADENTHMVFTDAVDFPGESKMSDTYHYTQEGYNEMGTTGGQNAAAAI